MANKNVNYFAILIKVLVVAYWILLGWIIFFGAFVKCTIGCWCLTCYTAIQQLSGYLWQIRTPLLMSQFKAPQHSFEGEGRNTTLSIHTKKKSKNQLSPQKVTSFTSEMMCSTLASPYPSVEQEATCWNGWNRMSQALGWKKDPHRGQRELSSNQIHLWPGLQEGWSWPMWVSSGHTTVGTSWCPF